MKEIANDYEALVLALKLAITGDNKSEVKECVKMADIIATKLPEIEVARAKKAALKEIEQEKQNEKID
jgi:hypothetical protein